MASLVLLVDALPVPANLRACSLILSFSSSPFLFIVVFFVFGFLFHLRVRLSNLYRNCYTVADASRYCFFSPDESDDRVCLPTGVHTVNSRPVRNRAE